MQTTVDLLFVSGFLGQVQHSLDPTPWLEPKWLYGGCVCLHVCLSLSLSLYIYIYIWLDSFVPAGADMVGQLVQVHLLPVCLSICLSVYLSVCLSVCPSVRPSSVSGIETDMQTAPFVPRNLISIKEGQSLRFEISKVFQNCNDYDLLSAWGEVSSDLDET